MPRDPNAALSTFSLNVDNYRSQLPAAYISSTRQNCLPQQLGRMIIQCESCSALHWLLERVKTSSKIHPQFESCCKQGSTILDPPKELLELLCHLFESDDIQARHFRENIRQYNSALAFTSLKCQPDTRLGPSAYKCFSIYGQLYHMSKSLSSLDENPENAQLYLYDSVFASAK